LNATSWNSLQEQNIPGFPAGNGTGNGWEQFGGSSSAVIGESYLTGDSRVSNATSIGLGAAFKPGAAHDLEFLYGVVPAGPAVTGDYNNNGTVDAADYVLWRKGGPLPNEGATPGSTTPEDYNVWRANFGLGADSIGTSTLVKGFVRYVSSGAATAVPEPSSVFLVAIGIGTLVGARRRE
jgi:PEP-CTERM motif